MHFLQCLDASHELEGVMTRVVSMDITVEGTLLNQDTRSMVQQSKVGITRSVVDGALVLEYEDMFTGKRSKLSRSQCLCPGRIEVPEARRFPNVLTPQMGPIGGLEGASVMSTSSPSIGFLQSSTSGDAVVELTSSRIDCVSAIESRRTTMTALMSSFSGPRAYRFTISSVSVRKPSSWSRPRC